MNEPRSNRYHRLKRRAAVASAVAGIALLVALVATGASAWIRDLAVAVTRAGESSLRTVALYVFVLLVLHEIVTFPLDLYRGFLLDRRYGLSTESLRSWLWDRAKAVTLGALVALGAGLTVYATLVRWPRWWWLACAIAFITAAGVLARLAPVLLLPLFYKFAPLERASLRDRLFDLSGRAGVPVLGVYEWGLGDKTSRANAALVGTGGTRRIIISDTLLAAYSDDEIEVILAHELAHHVHHDILKGLALEFVLLVASLGSGALALALAWPRLGLASIADVAGLPILLLAAGAVTLAATPFVNALSRAHERRADAFALSLTRQPEAFISAMRRLGAQNLAEESPSRTALWLFHTHPPIDDRIAAARAFVAAADPR